MSFIRRQFKSPTLWLDVISRFDFDQELVFFKVQFSVNSRRVMRVKTGTTYQQRISFNGRFL